MEHKDKIKLTAKQCEYLSSQPEQGMGYQIVDLILKNGERIDKRIVLNSAYLRLEANEDINPEEIVSITIHQD